MGLLQSRWNGGPNLEKEKQGGFKIEKVGKKTDRRSLSEPVR